MNKNEIVCVLFVVVVAAAAVIVRVDTSSSFIIIIIISITVMDFMVGILPDCVLFLERSGVMVNIRAFLCHPSVSTKTSLSVDKKKLCFACLFYVFFESIKKMAVGVESW